MIKELIGVPWKHKGRDLSGLDCWGLVLYVYRKLGIELDDSVDYKEGENFEYDLISSRIDRTLWHQVDINKIKPFDVMLLGNIFPSHFGIYIGNDRFLSCSKRSGVALYHMNSFWKRKTLSVWRYVGG